MSTITDVLAVSVESPSSLIGRNVELTTPRLLGRQQDELGFGADLNSTRADAILSAIVQADRVANADAWPFRHGEDHDAKARWFASVSESLSHSPYPVKDLFFTQVHEGLDRLEPRYVDPAFRLATVNHGLNFQPSADRRQLRWRYAAFATVLWHELAPHLRTREMLDPNGVWRTINRLAADERRLRGQDWLSDRQRRDDRINFALAIYERTLTLLIEIRQNHPRYRRAISERPAATPLSTDVILALPVDPLHPELVAEARRIRAEAYEDMLLTTLDNCAVTVCVAS